ALVLNRHFDKNFVNTYVIEAKSSYRPERFGGQTLAFGAGAQVITNFSFGHAFFEVFQGNIANILLGSPEPDAKLKHFLQLPVGNHLPDKILGVR
ncbi:MAG: hypothetical protein AVDCRST_MAG95-3312, partial [uncultured Adhaeribacter sp.]